MNRATMKRVVRRISLIAGLMSFTFTLASAALFGDTTQDSINATKSNFIYTRGWIAADTGWLYTPSSSYNLTEVLTRFGPVFSGTNPVTEVIYSGLPSSGGKLLRSAGFTALNGTFSGGSFPALPLVAGQSYFVGFEGVHDWALNLTADPGAVSLVSLYYDYDGSHTFSIVESHDGASQPILEFSGNIGSGPGAPEPGTLALLGTGLTALGGAVRRRL